jgi:hypothetical protein
MTSGIVNLGLLIAYVVLMAAIVIQYERVAIAKHRLPLLFGMCFTWIAYSLLQLPDVELVPTHPPLPTIYTVLSGVFLITGLYGLYWWWRHREPSSDGDETSNQ